MQSANQDCLRQERLRELWEPSRRGLSAEHSPACVPTQGENKGKVGIVMRAINSGYSERLVRAEYQKRRLSGRMCGDGGGDGNPEDFFFGT